MVVCHQECERYGTYGDLDSKELYNAYLTILQVRLSGRSLPLSASLPVASCFMAIAISMRKILRNSSNLDTRTRGSSKECRGLQQSRSRHAARKTRILIRAHQKIGASVRGKALRVRYGCESTKIYDIARRTWSPRL